MNMDSIEFYYLDFRHIERNQMVRDQGKTLCFKTKGKGYFSVELDRFPTRQDCAIITEGPEYERVK